MSPGLCVGLLACVCGICLQFTNVEAESVAGESEQRAVGNLERPSDGEVRITPSLRQREVSKRRRVSPFDSPNALVLAFLRQSATGMELCLKRKELMQEVNELRVAGLGKNHPDVIDRWQGAELIEAELTEGWERWRMLRPSGRGERLSR